MKKKVIIAYLCVVVALFVCTFCGVYIYQYYHGKNLTSSLTKAGGEVTVVSAKIPRKNEQETDTEPAPSTDTGNNTEPDEQDPAQDEPVEEIKTIEVPVDFDELLALNSDIYGWISIPDTVINYPVLQHPTNDMFYLNHGTDKMYYQNGSIFSESAYNSKDFEDNFIILYGHDIRNSSLMFSQLNNFIDSKYFDDHPEFYIYTPDTIYRYEIFAAFPFVRDHLIINGYVRDEEHFDRFFSRLPSRFPLYSNYREDLFPTYEDKVVVLSTCLVNNHTQRFLVMGKCAEIMRIENQQ